MLVIIKKIKRPIEAALFVVNVRKQKVSETDKF